MTSRKASAASASTASPASSRACRRVGYPGSLLAKTLLIEAEPGGRITVILVPETLGF